MSREKVQSLEQIRRQRRLLALVEGQAKRRGLPAERLVVDVDGKEVLDFVPGEEATVVAIPTGALLITLRDEMGTPRAVVMPDEGEVSEASFDDGRLRISVSTSSDATLELHVRAHEAAVQLAAAPAPTTADEERGIGLRFTEDGAPEIDEEGFFVMEAFCDKRYAGRSVRISAEGLDDFTETISQEGFLRVVREVPGAKPRVLAEADVTALLE